MFNTCKSLCFVFIMFCVLTLSACDITTKPTAVLDVNTIIATGPHAKNAQAEIAKAQAIYQYNLDVIEKKLEKYKNEKQAKAYLAEALRQLQVQLNTSKKAVTQVLANALSDVVNIERNDYALIILKNNVIHADSDLDITSKIQEKYNAKTIVYPPLPKKIDNPNLPKDDK